jgi:hypothetical protein
VPAYQAARQTAAGFFGAKDALGAGPADEIGVLPKTLRSTTTGDELASVLALHGQHAFA